MAKRLIPTLNRVLVEKITPPSKTIAGILLPEKTNRILSGQHNGDFFTAQIRAQLLRETNSSNFDARKLSIPVRLMHHFKEKYNKALISNNHMHTQTYLSQLLQYYSRAGNLYFGKQLHARLLTAGAAPTTFISNHLLNWCLKCHHLTHALNLFDTMPHRNPITWTVLITGFSHNHQFQSAIKSFSLMQANGITPTHFALSSVAHAAASLASLECGAQVHALSLKFGFGVELFVGSNLVDMYAKCGVMADACHIFEEIPMKDELLWTTLIDGYTKNGDHEAALVVFWRLWGEGAVTVDQHVLCSVLSACGDLKACSYGRSVHSCLVKVGFEGEVPICNALTDMYTKTRDMDSAMSVACRCWNVISCSSIINGYIEFDEIETALNTYVESRRQGIKPNEFTFSSMIKGCAAQAGLDQGIQLHAQVIKTSFVRDTFVLSVLIDMYGKCGLLNSSFQVFEEMRDLTSIAWNSMVGVLAQHGRGKEAIQVFDQMVSGGTKPNHITFVNLLTACSHSGLVEEGLKYFELMKSTHGIKPKEEHYSCIIDMLGRAGRLKEAEEFIYRMPFEPNAYGWCSLLGACKTHGNRVLAEVAAEKLTKLEPDNSGIHVLLSSVYATAGKWDDMKAMRKLIKDSGVKKLPGFSWVDVNNTTHVFGAEDWSHPQQKKIYEKLDELLALIREAGYVPFTGAVASNLEENLKERNLYHHSERIAVAFALISMPATKPIIVKKNLRVCVDCHSAIKLISKVMRREIIVRDNSRFHHFADGFCSCGDFW